MRGPIYDLRHSIVRADKAHGLARLDGYLIDVSALCDDMSERITGGEYPTDEPQVLRDAERLIDKLDRLHDDLEAFRKEYEGT